MSFFFPSHSYFHLQEGENEMLSVDARPSDALNIAYRCKVDILSLTAEIIAELMQVAGMT